MSSQPAASRNATFRHWKWTAWMLSQPATFRRVISANVNGLRVMMDGDAVQDRRTERQPGDVVTASGIEEHNHLSPVVMDRMHVILASNIPGHELL